MQYMIYTESILNCSCAAPFNCRPPVRIFSSFEVEICDRKEHCIVRSFYWPDNENT